MDLLQNLEIRQGSNGYSEQTILHFGDCDRFRRARMGTLLSQAAVIAGEDYEHRGLGWQKLADNQWVFLLSRIAMKVFEYPREGEVLTVTTWEDGVKGAQFQRIFEFTDGAGKLLAAMRSDWVLADPAEHRLLRPSAFTARPFVPSGRALDCPAPGRIPFPKEGFEELGTHRVTWSELDGNGHLFSGNYGDILWDALPDDLQDKTVRELYLNYNHEAHFNDTLTLRGAAAADGGFLVQAAGEETTCFTAKIVFA